LSRWPSGPVSSRLFRPEISFHLSDAAHWRSPQI